MGVVDMIKQKSQKDVKVKVLSLIDSEVKKVLMYLSDDINNRDSPYIVREIAKQKDFKRTILLVDRKYFLAIEPRDDSKDTSNRPPLYLHTLQANPTYTPTSLSLKPFGNKQRWRII